MELKAEVGVFCCCEDTVEGDAVAQVLLLAVAVPQLTLVDVDIDEKDDWGVVVE